MKKRAHDRQYKLVKRGTIPRSSMQSALARLFTTNITWVFGLNTYAISGAGAFGADCKPYIALGPADGKVVTKITEYFWSFETNYVLEAFLAMGCRVRGAYT